MKFSELVRLLEANGFTLVRQKGAVRYYGKAGWPRLIRVDYHGAKQVPTGTCHAILKAAGVPKPGQQRADEPPPDEQQPEEEQP
ncbi:MAG TPA: type II toxin-antitoxin system HicA family toxin [Gemmataceae bacterium]|nr:type II toxin-antitoxin system HicA family toxin [Gemmataceae bacterium]